MRTILHIGLEKTGTTTIQRFLDINRGALARSQRLAVTRSCGVGNCRDLATYAIRDGYFNEDHLIELGIQDVPAKERFRRLVESRLSAELSRLAAECDRLILSSEHFQSRLKSEEEVDRLRRVLSSNGLRVTLVLVYLRDPARLIQSIYSTALKVGRAFAPPDAADNPHWNHICDHRRTIELWSSVFTDARIVPRLFEPGQLRDGDLLADFCSESEIERGGLAIPPRQNPSLDADGQMLLRTVNAEVPWLMDGRHQKLRQEVVEYVSRHFTGPAPPPSSALMKSCEQRFQESNEWVRARYFPHLTRLFDSPAKTAPSDEGEAAERLERLARAEGWLADRLGARVASRVTQPGAGPGPAARPTEE